MQFERKIVPMFGEHIIYEWHIPTILCHAPFHLGSSRFRSRIAR